MQDERTDGRTIGLALGGGGARGWAHLGVIRALREMGVRPHLVAGSSIGALVGGCHAAGCLDELETFARGIRLATILAYLDPSWSGSGLIGGSRVTDWLRDHLGERDIAALHPSFAAVATEIDTGRAVWLADGDLVTAIRASISMPGFFTPVRIGESWLADGGIVDPEPVALARDMGADVVIAVRLTDRPSLRPPLRLRAADGVRDTGEHGWLDQLAADLPGGLRDPASRLIDMFRRDRNLAPRYLDVMANTVDIMAGLVSRARFAAYPADVTLTPRVHGIRVLAFHQADTAIAAGEAVVREMAPLIRRALDMPPPQPPVPSV